MTAALENQVDAPSHGVGALDRKRAHGEISAADSLEGGERESGDGEGGDREPAAAGAAGQEEEGSPAPAGRASKKRRLGDKDDAQGQQAAA
jgi:hypothetical protein